jgi:hypothetical protein
VYDVVSNDPDNNPHGKKNKNGIAQQAISVKLPPGITERPVSIQKRITNSCMMAQV